MKSKNFNLIRIDADEGKVFDWANLTEHQKEDLDTHEMVLDHLYVKTLFLGSYDDIENYVEVDEPRE